MNVIDDLLALQEQDRAILELKKKVRDIPLRRKQEEESVTAVEERIRDAEDMVRRTEAKNASIELDIASTKESLERYEKQGQGIRAQEYDAMLRQKSAKTNALRDLEEQLAQGRSLIETVRADVQALQSTLESERASAASVVDMLNRQLAEAQKELMAAEEQRKSLVAVLDVPEKRRFLSYYERLGKKFFPVVEHIDGTSCPGCHMTLTASKIQEAHRNAMLASDPAKAKDMKTVACDYCGRLLYKN